MLGVSDPRQQVLLTDIPDLAVDGTLQQKLDALIEILRRVVREPIYRVVFTPPDSPLQVVRVVVPLMENLKETRVRLGRRLKAAIEAQGRVGLMLNVQKGDLGKVLALLPALQRPTISSLSEGDWVAVNTIIEERTVRDLIPKLKAAGGQGIVEYPLNKIVV